MDHLATANICKCRHDEFKPLLRVYIITEKKKTLAKLSFHELATQKYVLIDSQ